MYNIGDKVKIREDLNSSMWGVADIMIKYKGRIVTITAVHQNMYTKTSIYQDMYKIEEDSNEFDWGKDMFETIVPQSSGKLQDFITANNLTEDEAIKMLEWHLNK